MKTLVLKELKQPLVPEDRDDLQPGSGEVVIALKAAALNRRDYWITQGMYPGTSIPVVLGSDGAGVVISSGENVDQTWVGKEVIINPGWNWGLHQASQSNGFEILGMPRDGTFAEQVKVPAEYVHDRPSHLSWHESAAIPLAGVTAYRALFSQGNLQPGENVLINGIGGGVASFALQYAVTVKANVFVTSSSDEKLATAATLGAKGGFNYTTENWHRAASSEHGDMDLIIDSAGGDGYASLLELSAPGGRVVNYGATAGPPKQLDLFKVFWKQLHLIGSTMGSPADFEAMLAFISEHQLRPAVDQVFDLADGNTAMKRMQESQQFGKIVLQIAS